MGFTTRNVSEGLKLPRSQQQSLADAAGSDEINRRPALVSEYRSDYNPLKVQGRETGTSNFVLE